MRPAAPFLNSQYDGSFVAGLCQLRYIYSMSVERIVNFFRENGFKLEKPTAHHLLGKTAVLFENLYEALREVVLEDPYLCCDETYHKVLVPEKNSKGKGVRKGYIWAAAAATLKLVLYFYEGGSRRQEVLLISSKPIKEQYKVMHTPHTGNWKPTNITISRGSHVFSTSNESFLNRIRNRTPER